MLTLQNLEKVHGDVQIVETWTSWYSTSPSNATEKETPFIMSGTERPATYLMSIDQWVSPCLDFVVFPV